MENMNNNMNDNLNNINDNNDQDNKKDKKKMSFKKGAGIALCAVLAGGLASVSYTHLDVYKRQHLFCVQKNEF